jgi:hypothetical protein
MCDGVTTTYKSEKEMNGKRLSRRIFEPMVMFFGKCNSPATFQAMMDDIFMTMIDN